jgi:hypothetical protein
MGKGGDMSTSRIITIGTPPQQQHGQDFKAITVHGMEELNKTENSTAIAAAGDEITYSHKEEVPLDLDNPHRAALEHNPDTAELPAKTTIAAIVVRPMCSRLALVV